MNNTVTAIQYGTPSPERQARAGLRTGLRTLEAYDIEWDQDARVTPAGSLAYFAQFLRAGGRFDALCQNAPLRFASHNAHDPRDILGTLLLALLNGHARYAHITALRNDRVSPGLMGFSKIVSEDSVRRAFAPGRATPEELDTWLCPHETATLLPLLKEPHILDLDSTVKPLYGHQEAAEVGYNPQKPGRPSHTLHTCLIAPLRLVLSVDTQSGKAHAGNHGLPTLWRRLDALPPQARPRLLRGDVSYGNETLLHEAETRALPYLFKLARHKTVQSAFRRLCHEESSWTNAGDGWQGCETRLQLAGWSRQRRCLLLRRPASAPAQTNPGRALPSGRQREFEFMRGVRAEPGWNWLCLVTSDETLDPAALSQLYRDRADCENVFDEIKNQWAWSGFMTRDLQRCRVMARLTALVYNWWNIFTRLACPDVHLEAVTSRPLLMGAVGRLIQSGRRKLLRLTSNHAMADKIRRVLESIRVFLNRLASTAEQLSPAETWAVLLYVAFRKWLKGKPPGLNVPMTHDLQLLLVEGG